MSQEGYSEDAYADQGNRFLIGNGYLGVRGTLDEDRKDKLAAVNLAGVFDQLPGKVSEPLNAPNPFYTSLQVGSEFLCPESGLTRRHFVSLDYRHGLFSRQTDWETESGEQIRVNSTRFVCMDNKHLSAVQYCISVGATGATFLLYTGIDSDVWELNGPHYTKCNFETHHDGVTCEAFANAGKTKVMVSRRFYCDPTCCVSFEETSQKGILCAKISLSPNESWSFSSIQVVSTSKDSLSGDSEIPNLWDPSNSQLTYAGLLERQRQTWEVIWEDCEVKIHGDDMAMRALNYSLYHLNSIAPSVGSAQSIGARGLSGQTYKGAVFWDTEMFIFDFFLYTRPEIAKELVRYRIHTLSGAKAKALHYGWKGAFYAWESQENGYDACSEYNIIDVFTQRPMRTYFRDKQIHVSAAVVHAIWNYIICTGDETILLEGGAETIFECAEFYLSVLLQPVFLKDVYEIHDVVGPDEYHERINNDAYTNKMVQETFRIALAAAERIRNFPKLWQSLDTAMKLDNLLADIRKANDKLFIPQPNEHGIIEQFSGYFKLADKTIQEVREQLLDPKEYWGGAYGVASDTQVIKQADVIAMLEVFHEEYSKDVLRANWDYYEPRTEHGSSLSSCMYALTACRFGDAERAYPFFLKSASAEIEGGGKQWAGLLYIGGTHPAAAGGAWKAAVQGFAGLRISENGMPMLEEHLPTHWKSMEFTFYYLGRKYRAYVSHSKCSIIPET